MDKKIKLVVVIALVSSVLAFVILMFITSAIMKVVPPRTAIILSAAVAITDLSVAFHILNKPSNPGKPK